MAATTTFDLAVQSFKELGYEFLATVLGFSSSQTTLTACAAEPAVSDQGKPQTYFFLNPWETYDESRNIPPECIGMDWTVILFLAGIIFVWFWVPRFVLYEPYIARRKQGDAEFTRQKAVTFGQQVALLSHFILSAIFAFRILWPKEWLLSRHAWVHRTDLVDADFKFYYLIYAARMIAEFCSLFLERRTGANFWAPFYHHLVTFGLVVGSAYFGYMRYGGIIMFFFDWADIPLLAAKSIKLMSLKPGDIYSILANLLWANFLFSYFFQRILYYDYIVYAALLDRSSIAMVLLLLLLAAVQHYWLYTLFLNFKKRQKQYLELQKKAREEAKKKK